MWLQNTKNNRYYPYTDFLAKHNGMIIVYSNPFKTPEEDIKKESAEEVEERLYVEEEEDFDTISELIEKQEKPSPKKGRPKK